MNVDDISKIGVIGAGLMGHGIALNFALGGYDVYLNDTTDESLEKALESVGTSLETMLNVGLADEASAVAVPGRIHTSTSMEETVADVDFVVEAVFARSLIPKSLQRFWINYQVRKSINYVLMSPTAIPNGSAIL